jgi:hypothetical protein
MATTDPTFADRLAALEGRIGALTLDDLPLGPLQRKLENDWQPDSAVLLQPNSITLDQLASGLKLAVGKSTAVFTASTDSATVTVKHSLGVVPLAAGGFSAVGAVGGFGDIPAFHSFNLTNTSFDVNARKPLASTVNVDFYWLAVA